MLWRLWGGPGKTFGGMDDVGNAKLESCKKLRLVDDGAGCSSSGRNIVELCTGVNLGELNATNAKDERNNTCLRRQS